LQIYSQKSGQDAVPYTEEYARENRRNAVWPWNLNVKITDDLSATTLPSDESFEILANSGAHEVFRRVALGRDGHNED